MKPEIFTVGHSTHPIERFLSLLRGAGIEAIADVRRFPGSRRHPQFGADTLAESLGSHGIDYEPFREQLGGRRSRKDAEGASPPDNSAWRNASFRAYADYMSTDAFAAGLLARSWRVVHLLPDGRQKSTSSPPTPLSRASASTIRPSPRWISRSVSARYVCSLGQGRIGMSKSAGLVRRCCKSSCNNERNTE